MAKKSMIAREEKRISLVKKHLVKRNALRKILNDFTSSTMEKIEAQIALQKLPRDSSPVRIRNRCSITGRPHGYFRRFGLSRNKLRENAMSGNIPGIVKSSW